MYELKFAETLSALIKEKQIKLGDVSAAVGVTNQSISAYCLGNITPKYSVLLKLADYFGVTPTYLLTGFDASNEIEHKDLGLSGTAIRLLKGCNPEQLRNVDTLLSDADFYNRFEFCLSNCSEQADTVLKTLPTIKKHQELQDIYIRSVIFDYIDNLCDHLKDYFKAFLIDNTAMRECVRAAENKTSLKADNKQA